MSVYDQPPPRRKSALGSLIRVIGGLLVVVAGACVAIGFNLAMHNHGVDPTDEYATGAPMVDGMLWGGGAFILALGVVRARPRGGPQRVRP